MKRFLALLLAAMLLFSSAIALELPYPADTVLSVCGLTPAQAALRDALYTPVFCHQERIELPDKTTAEDVSAAMRSLMQDYPELFHLGKTYTFGYYRNEPDYITWVEPAYRMSAEEAASIRAVLYAQAYLLADAFPDAEALHDRLCELVTYGGDTDMRHTAPGALLDGRATCEGYAQALTLLYRMAGIPCGMISGTAVDASGTASAHSWNIADINGLCLIDATWNDQDALGLNTHWYYGLSTGEMAVDHTPDADQTVPLCSGEANWHDRHGYIVHDADQADIFIRRLVAGETINLRVPDRTMYTALTDDLSAWLEHYNELNPVAAFYGGYSMTCSDAQQCVIIQRVE